MCTSFTFYNNKFYFGRNLDLEYRFGEKVVITPRNYILNYKEEKQNSSHFAFIGMARVEDNYPLYAEAANEKGLCMAGLNFPSNAYYNPEKEEGKINVTPYEIIPYILAECSSADEAAEKIKNLNLIAIEFKKGMALAPLHWIISDKEKSFVVEPTKEGIKLYENPVGVLTNNPEFSFHITNLSHYLNITSNHGENRFSEKLDIKPFGEGFGAIGLPGDFSPASRFIRTVFNKYNSRCDETENASVSQVFHILDSVAMVRGTVLTPDGKPDYTTYSCCINASKGIYYYKTYENNQITAIRMQEENLQGEKLATFAPITQQQIFYANGQTERRE